MAENNYHKVVIGRSVLISLVDVGIADVPAKVDTGAYSCAIHADNIQLSDDGRSLHFRLFGGHPVVNNKSVDMTTEQFTVARISNSFGGKEKRYIVKLRIKLGPKIVTTAFSLANRSNKMFPVLIGRRLLNGRFMVDTANSQVDRVALQQEFGISFPNDEEEAQQ